MSLKGRSHNQPLLLDQALVEEPNVTARAGGGGGADLNLDDLATYFHLPIAMAAKEIGVCATVLKKICRKNKVPRWPHRKIKSLNKSIDALERTLSQHPEQSTTILSQISDLKSKKDTVMKYPETIVNGGSGLNVMISPASSPAPLPSSALPSQTTSYNPKRKRERHASQRQLLYQWQQSQQSVRFVQAATTKRSGRSSRRSTISKKEKKGGEDHYLASDSDEVKTLCHSDSFSAEDVEATACSSVSSLDGVSVPSAAAVIVAPTITISGTSSSETIPCPGTSPIPLSVAMPAPSNDSLHHYHMNLLSSPHDFEMLMDITLDSSHDHHPFGFPSSRNNSFSLSSPSISSASTAVNSASPSAPSSANTTPRSHYNSSTPSSCGGSPFIPNPQHTFSVMPHQYAGLNHPHHHHHSHHTQHLQPFVSATSTMVSTSFVSASGTPSSKSPHTPFFYPSSPHHLADDHHVHHASGQWY